MKILHTTYTAVLVGQEGGLGAKLKQKALWVEIRKVSWNDAKHTGFHRKHSKSKWVRKQPQVSSQQIEKGNTPKPGSGRKARKHWKQKVPHVTVQTPSHFILCPSSPFLMQQSWHHHGIEFLLAGSADCLDWCSNCNLDT